MIISDERKFVFVHIPKCGGTSLRMLLDQYDTRDGAYTNRIEQHNTLGPLDYVHIPLCTMRDYFENEFDALRNYRSFAIVRDPLSRFPSSLNQWLKNVKKQRVLELDEGSILRLVEQKLVELNNNPEPLTPDMIHFRRQSDYIFLDGVQIVEKLYKLENLDDEITLIGSYLGLDLDEITRANQSVRYRNKAIKTIIENFKPTLLVGWRLLPIKIKEYLYSRVFQVNDGGDYVRGTNKSVIEIISKEGFDKAITEHYAQDVELYNNFIDPCEHMFSNKQMMHQPPQKET